MEGVSTMNLSDTDAMTPLFGGRPSPPPSAVPFAPTPDEKNISTMQMDSTPISDIMSQDVEYAQGQQQQYMTPPPVQQVAQAAQKKGPMNLTQEQMEALLAGLVAVVAFSTPVQERLVGFLPQMIEAGGDRSNIGLLVTAIVAALIFYFARRFVVK
jgi:hypothetical protein